MGRLTRLYGDFDINRLGRELPRSLIDRMRIFIDGDRIRTITAVSTAAGWVRYNALDDQGRQTGRFNEQQRAGQVLVYVDRLTAAEAQALLASGRTYELGSAHPGCRG
jgi:hypothetical protein